jgi:hypothetical protein
MPHFYRDNDGRLVVKRKTYVCKRFPFDVSIYYECKFCDGKKCYSWLNKGWKSDLEIIHTCEETLHKSTEYKSAIPLDE